LDDAFSTQQSITPILQRLIPPQRLLEKDFSEFFYVFAITIAPARVGGIQLGAFLELRRHIGATGKAIETANQLLTFLGQNKIDKQLPRIRMQRLVAERDWL